MTAGSAGLRFRQLQRRLAEHAKATGVPIERMYKRFSHALICDVLARAVQQGAIPMFFVKGGVALDLRMGIAARATKDLDIGIPSAPDKMLESLNAALEVGAGDYTYRVRDQRSLPNGTVRCDVSISFCGRSLVNADVDLSPAGAGSKTEIIVATEFVELGVEPIRVPCLSLPQQVAQKIHAATEPQHDGRRNDRHRDVVDIVLLDEQGWIDDAKVRLECERTFAERGTHEWPPQDYSFPAHWHTDMDVPKGHSDSVAMERAFTKLIERLTTTVA